MDEADLLYVSDDPETFRGHGRLFHASLPSDGTVARVLFDHVNGTRTPMRVMAGIANTGDSLPGSLAILGGGTKPQGNFMSAGHDATMRYLQARAANAVSHHDVPAGIPFVLADFVLQPGQCVAGIYDVGCETPDAEFEVRIIACDPAHDALAVYDDLEDSPDDGKSRRGVFDISGTAEPQPIAFGPHPVEIGANAATCSRSAAFDTYGGPDHKGEYGVVKQFTCDISGRPSARLYQSARGGDATATYVVNGTLVQSRRFSPNKRLKVGAFDPADGAGATVTVVTMPEINSTYPVQLSIDANDVAIAEAGTAGSPIVHSA